MNDSQLIDRLRGLDAPVDPSPRFSDELFDTLQRERRGGAGRRFRLERPQLLQMAAAGLAVITVIGFGLSLLSKQNGPAVTPVTSPSPAPSAPPATPTVAPTAEMTLRPVGSDAGPTPEFVSWSEPWTGEIASVVEWGEGLVTVGNLRGTNLQGFARPGSGAVWTSSDGQAWERLTLTDQVDRSELVEAYVASTGELVVMTAPEDRFRRRAWRTSDGQTWTSVEMPMTLRSPHVVGRPGAYLMIDEDSTSELWASNDGLTWEPLDLAELDPNAGIVDIAVGDRGRLLSTCDRKAGEEEGTLPEILTEHCRTWVSTDGSTWVPSDVVPSQLRVAWFGNEWVAASAPEEPLAEPQIQLWRSANGLEWVPTSQVTKGFVGRRPDRLFPAGEHLVLKAGTAYTRTLVCNESVVCQPTGIEHIIAQDAAGLGDLVVLVGSSYGTEGYNWSWNTAAQ